MAAGVIADPYLDGNEAGLTWMYDIDWRYATVLDPRDLPLTPTGPHERVDLVFDGIDTVATVRLGEGSRTRSSWDAPTTCIARTVSIFRRISVAACSTSKLIFTQPPRTPKPNDNDLGTVPGPTHRRTTSFARWLAALAGTGGPTFAQPVCGSRCGSSVGALRGWLSVTPLITVDDAGNGRVELRIDLERLDSGAALTVTADILGHQATSAVAAGGASTMLVVDVPEAPIWWPMGYGEQPLADLTVTLSAADQELDRWQRRVGFRTVELIRHATRSAPHSGCRSTVSRCSSKASTGSPMITS